MPSRCSTPALLTLLIALAVPVAAAGQTATPAKPVSREETRELNLKAYVELLRSDLRTQKVAVFAALVPFSDAEDRAFWPIYREHENDQRRLNDERLALVESYAREYLSLTPDAARRMITQALDLEARRTKLKQQYFTKLTAAISPVTAARVLQLEHQLQLLVDLQVAASLPIVQTEGETR